MPKPVSGFACVVCDQFFVGQDDAAKHESVCLRRKAVRDAFTKAKAEGGGWRIEKVRQECPHLGKKFDGWGNHGSSDYSCPDCGESWNEPDPGR